MESIPKIIMDAKIFKPGDIYIFTELEDRGFETDPIEILYTIRCEEDIVLGLEFSINYILKDKLKKILTCRQVSEYAFELSLRVHERGEGEVRRNVYLQRILTLQERIQEAEMRYGVRMS